MKHSTKIFGALLLLALLAVAWVNPEAFHLRNLILAAACTLPFIGLVGEAGAGDVTAAIKGVRDTVLGKFEEISDANQRRDEELASIRSHVDTLRKSALNGAGASARPRGRVSDDAARALGATFIGHLARCGRLEAFMPDASKRDAVYNEAKSVLGRALTTTETPLPITYSGQLTELIAEFGVARQNLRMYPMGGGTNKPPRMGTRPAFESVAMSAAMPEKKPAFGFASLESHKIGGYVLAPRELDDQSIVPLGQFLAMYGAVEFARAEDTWAFLADGTATYESVAGICKTAEDNSKVVHLGATKTAPTDSERDDFRALRRKVNTSVLSRGGKYYINATFESHLRGFNSQNEPNVFIYRPDGMAVLDGFPVVWTEVLTACDSAANADKPIAVFGNLDFWWFGERGVPRIDVSEHPFFIYDQIATRFIEEIDFDYSALDAAAVLKTAAS